MTASADFFQTKNPCHRSRGLLNDYSRYPRNRPTDKRKPKIVFVCAVAFIAGIICIGSVLPMKPFVALMALGALRTTIASHGVMMLMAINMKTHA